MTLILVTNDDGVQAPGLQVLYNEAKKIGRPVIIAPDRDNSAASHSLTMNRPLRVRELEPDIYSIDGTPTDAVTIGIGKILDQKPDLVISGINPGANLGDDVSYSGTVSAAIEATMLGIPSIALSVASSDNGPVHYQTAAAFGLKVAAMMLQRGLPPDTLLNVNVPNCDTADIRGISFTRRGRRLYEGAIKETFDPWGRKHYWIGGGTPSWDTGEDTDSSAIAANTISITPMHLDPTNYQALRFLNEQWGELKK